jgi:hypothetical protein
VFFNIFNCAAELDGWAPFRFYWKIIGYFSTSRR